MSLATWKHCCRRVFARLMTAFLLLLETFVFLPVFSAFAEPAVSSIGVGGVKAVLIKPEKPIASLILLAGGDGNIGVGEGGVIARQVNQLVRTRMLYAKRGFAVLVPNVGYDLPALVELMKTIKRPVTVVGTSAGTRRAAVGLVAGARPDKLVLTAGALSPASGNRENVMLIIKNKDLLPPTLIVHHRQDSCKKTLPAGVPYFMDWAQGKARVVWLDGGISEGVPCKSLAHHGFNGIDGKVVNVIASFAR